MSLGGPDVPNAPGIAAGLSNSLTNPFATAAFQTGINTTAALQNQAGSQGSTQTPLYNQNYTQVGTGAGGVPIYGVNQAFTDPQAQSNFSNYLQNQGWAGQQARNTSGQGQDFINNAYQPYAAAQMYQQGGVGMLNNANQTVYNQADPAFSRQGMDLQGAENALNHYFLQDPRMLGGMSSGLAGERMDAYMKGIQPFQQTNRDQLDTQLRNQGLHPGMPGYDTALRQLDNSQTLANNTAYSQFQPQAWQQAMQIFQEPLAKQQAALQQAGAFGNQGQSYLNMANAQAGLGSQFGALSNAATNTGQAYGNLGANLQSQALPWLAASAPSQPPVPQNIPLNIQPSNLLGATTAYNSALNQNFGQQLSAYQAQQQQNQNMLSGLFGIGSSALGAAASGGLFSERRLKTNIVPVGTLPNGINLYSFNYKAGGATLIGPMAEEVEKIMPAAVTLHDGIKVVNYDMVLA